MAVTGDEGRGVASALTDVPWQEASDFQVDVMPKWLTVKVAAPWVEQISNPY